MTPRITKVRVRRLVSGPDFSNRAIEAEVEVGDSRPDDVLREAEEWIAAHLACPNLVRGFTPHAAEMLADQVRDLALSAVNLRRRLASLLGDHEHRPHNYGALGLRCRLCDEPMPENQATAADPTESHTDADPDVPF